MWVFVWLGQVYIKHIIIHIVYEKILYNRVRGYGEWRCRKWKSKWISVDNLLIIVCNGLTACFGLVLMCLPIRTEDQLKKKKKKRKAQEILIWSNYQELIWLNQLDIFYHFIIIIAGIHRLPDRQIEEAIH